MFEEMDQNITDFYRASDRFIEDYALHEVKTCAYCGTIIDPEESYKKAEDMYFHRDCFLKFMRGE